MWSRPKTLRSPRRPPENHGHSESLCLHRLPQSRGRISQQKQCPVPRTARLPPLWYLRKLRLINQPLVRPDLDGKNHRGTQDRPAAGKTVLLHGIKRIHRDQHFYGCKYALYYIFSDVNSFYSTFLRTLKSCCTTFFRTLAHSFLHFFGVSLSPATFFGQWTAKNSLLYIPHPRATIITVLAPHRNID